MHIQTVLQEILKKNKLELQGGRCVSGLICGRCGCEGAGIILDGPELSEESI